MGDCQKKIMIIYVLPASGIDIGKGRLTNVYQALQLLDFRIRSCVKTKNDGMVQNSGCQEVINGLRHEQVSRKFVFEQALDDITACQSGQVFHCASVDVTVSEAIGIAGVSHCKCFSSLKQRV